MNAPDLALPPLASAPATGPLVAVLAYNGLCTFEFAVAYEVFGLNRPEMGPGWYRYLPCAVEPGPLQAGGGMVVLGARGLDLLDEADLVIVPGWRGIRAPVPESLCEALRRAHRRGARIVSLCSGVFVLAAAGLLDGRRATTHWRYLDALKAAYPALTIAPDVLYVDEGSILTAAGSAAAIDLCLHIIRKDFGPDAANSVARRLVVPPHRDGGQAQYIERPVPEPREGLRLSSLIDWMRGHLDQDQPIAALAARAGMSIRTFQRRFEETTGMPPGTWLVRERVARAQELLERPGPARLDDIALASGFGSLATFRHHFRARLSTSPSAYRARFAKTTPSQAVSTG